MVPIPDAVVDEEAMVVTPFNAFPADVAVDRGGRPKRATLNAEVVQVSPLLERFIKINHKLILLDILCVSWVLFINTDIEYEGEDKEEGCQGCQTEPNYFKSLLVSVLKLPFEGKVLAGFKSEIPNWKRFIFFDTAVKNREEQYLKAEGENIEGQE